MSEHSYPEQMNKTKVMLAGLKTNQERMTKRGLATEFVNQLEQVYQQIMTIDNEQEALKAKLKVKTSEMTNRLEEMDKLYREAKKVVKLEMAQEAWREFGIEDQR